MGIVIGIDVGISTTKIVGLRNGVVVSPIRITAADPVTSLYGAFGKYLYDNHKPSAFILLARTDEGVSVMIEVTVKQYLDEELTVPVYMLFDSLGKAFGFKLDENTWNMGYDKEKHKLSIVNNKKHSAIVMTISFV